MKRESLKTILIIILGVGAILNFISTAPSPARIEELSAANAELIFDNAILREESTERLETIRVMEAQIKSYEDMATDTCYIERLGTFNISYYAPGDEGVDDITATGTTVTVGRTVAVDPSVIPYGSEVYIQGIGWRIAEDTGGAIVGMKMDVFVGDHNEAIQRGRHDAIVYIKRIGGLE